MSRRPRINNDKLTDLGTALGEITRRKGIMMSKSELLGIFRNMGLSERRCNVIITAYHDGADKWTGHQAISRATAAATISFEEPTPTGTSWGSVEAPREATPPEPFNSGPWITQHFRGRNLGGWVISSAQVSAPESSQVLVSFSHPRMQARFQTIYSRNTGRPMSPEPDEFPRPDTAFDAAAWQRRYARRVDGWNIERVMQVSNHRVQVTYRNVRTGGEWHSNYALEGRLVTPLPNPDSDF